MNLESYKKNIAYFMVACRKLELELTTYRILFVGLDHAYPEEHLADKFQNLLTSPAHVTDMREKYDVPLTRFLQQSDQSSLEKEILKWILEQQQTNQGN
jgi:hypothetical protein